MIKLVSSLVAPYDGDSTKLDCTLDSLRTLSPLITDDNKATTFQAIASRMSDKARQSLPTINENTTIELIITGLQKCKVKTSPEAALNLLNATKQTGDLKTFTNEIEKKMLALERAYKDDEMADATASRYATKAAIKALANGLKSSEVRTIVKAGRFDKLSEAIDTATEESIDRTTSPTNVASVLSYYRNFGNNQSNGFQSHNFGYRNNGNYRGNRNFQGNGNFQRNENYRGNRNSNNLGNGNFQNNGNFRNNNQRYNTFRNNGNFNNQRHNNNNNSNNNQGTGRRIFVANAENGQIPQQQQQVGGTALPQVQIASIQQRQ